MLLGDIIKQYRKEHHMSLQDFADLVHTSRSYIHMLEKNYNPSTSKPISPSIETLKCISRAMNIDIEDLLKKLDNNQNIYLDENEYKKQFKMQNNSKYSENDDYVIDTEGLTDEDIEDIKKYIEFIKNKKGIK